MPVIEAAISDPRRPDDQVLNHVSPEATKIVDATGGGTEHGRVADQHPIVTAQIKSQYG
jgi:hypothetical protein